MAYNEELAQRVRIQLQDLKGICERKMFGGLCFLLRGNMICGIVKENLMLRVGPDQYEKALKRKHARVMDFTGRPLKGFVYVDSDGLKSSAHLRSWIILAENFVSTLPRKLVFECEKISLTGAHL